MTEEDNDIIEGANQDATDALHSELSNSEKVVGDLVRNSMAADPDAPPMPEDLLDEVLGDLGVKSVAAAGQKRVESASLVDRLFSLLRANPVVWGAAAAAACVVAMLAIQMEPNGNGGGGVRGDGGEGLKDEPLVLLFQPGEELRREAEKLEQEHVRYPESQAELDRLLDLADRPRIVIAGDEVSVYPTGAQQADESEPAPEFPDEVVDLILEIAEKLRSKNE